MSHPFLLLIVWGEGGNRTLFTGATIQRTSTNQSCPHNKTISIAFDHTHFYYLPFGAGTLTRVKAAPTRSPEIPSGIPSKLHPMAIPAEMTRYIIGNTGFHFSRSIGFFSSSILSSPLFPVRPATSNSNPKIICIDSHMAQGFKGFCF